MKPLFVSCKGEYCTLESHVINDFMFNKKVIYCTKLDSRHNIRFQFIVGSYNFNQLIANIALEDIPTFIRWRNMYLPGTKTIVNIYDDDHYEALYDLGTDYDLNIKCTFYKDIVQLLRITTVAYQTPANIY